MYMHLRSLNQQLGISHMTTDTSNCYTMIVISTYSHGPLLHTVTHACILNLLIIRITLQGYVHMCAHQCCGIFCKITNKIADHWLQIVSLSYIYIVLRYLSNILYIEFFFFCEQKLSQNKYTKAVYDKTFALCSQMSINFLTSMKF